MPTDVSEKKRQIESQVNSGIDSSWKHSSSLPSRLRRPPPPHHHHPGGARRGLEKRGAALVLGSFACLCNRKHSPRGPCQQTGEMQMGGEKAPRWRLDPVQMWLQPPGWSQRWQSASTDGWTKQGTGCENGWGQSGNLTQTKKMKDGEELPTEAFRQYKSQSNLLTANWAQECVHQRALPLTTMAFRRLIELARFHAIISWLPLFQG